MADTLKRMYFGQPGTASATLYTAPGTASSVSAAVVRTIHVANTSLNASTFTLGLGGTATLGSGGTADIAANQIISTFTVPAYGLFVENVSILMNQGEILTGKQSTTGSLTMIISGVEL